MAPTNDKKDLILAQGQYAYIQDETKGLVKVHVGPITFTPSGNDKAVRYDPNSRKFVGTDSLEIQQNPTAAEGSYIILENPTEKGNNPSPGMSHSPSDLQIGRKVNIPGPATFALWPGQIATVVEGHQLKSNEYVRVRIYNVEEAKKNWPQGTGLPLLPDHLAVGQVIIVKGTNVNFFIPPTGVEVLPDPVTRSQFVLQAVTLERLEYCLLLDENGNKRYERGPAVVFPTATEKFVSKQTDSALPAEKGEGDPRRTVKLKAIELNDQMGLYIKVIADYFDEIDEGPIPGVGRKGEVVIADRGTIHKLGRVVRQIEHKAGEELFITGKDQRIYYPRPEHAIIEYGSEDGKFKRQRYYAIAIPPGEARYVLDKEKGIVRMEKGPKVFLPDPRKEIIVRRVLDKKTVGLWYPSNDEAAAYNAGLEAMTEASSNYVMDTSYNAAMDLARTINRGTRGTSALSGSGASIQGDIMKRGTQFTPPPSLTLNTKYDGPPTISPWTGYVVQIVDKSGKRRVVKGPTTILLEYDETLERLSLSSGNPKSTDHLINDVYLRVDHNKVSDTIECETKDMVTAKIKVSYRVNFEGDQNKWFSVENYVKFMTDHCRSLVRAKVKHLSIKQLIDESSSIVRDTILGVPDDKTKQRPGKSFIENGMRIYDVEVLKTEITDNSVSTMIQNSQKEAVQSTLALTAKQQLLRDTTELERIEQELLDLTAVTAIKRLDVVQKRNEKAHDGELAAIAQKLIRETEQQKINVTVAKLVGEVVTEQLRLRKEEDLADASRMEKETAEFVKRMGVVDPKLVTAIQELSRTGMITELAAAISPIAVAEHQGIGPMLERLFKGTGFADKITEVLTSGNGGGK